MMKDFAAWLPSGATWSISARAGWTFVCRAAALMSMIFALGDVPRCQSSSLAVSSSSSEPVSFLRRMPECLHVKNVFL